MGSVAASRGEWWLCQGGELGFRGEPPAAGTAFACSDLAAFEKQQSADGTMVPSYVAGTIVPSEKHGSYFSNDALLRGFAGRLGWDYVTTCRFLVCTQALPRTSNYPTLPGQQYSQRSYAPGSPRGTELRRAAGEITCVAVSRCDRGRRIPEPQAMATGAGGGKRADGGRFGLDLAPLADFACGSW